jgi:hypothetical protein
MSAKRACFARSFKVAQLVTKNVLHAPRSGRRRRSDIFFLLVLFVAQKHGVVLRVKPVLILLYTIPIGNAEDIVHFTEKAKKKATRLRKPKN